jgi:cytochrome bd-type quinol oxidase subunit 2
MEWLQKLGNAFQNALGVILGPSDARLLTKAAQHGLVFAGIYGIACALHTVTSEQYLAGVMSLQDIIYLFDVFLLIYQMSVTLVKHIRQTKDEASVPAWLLVMAVLIFVGWIIIGFMPNARQRYVKRLTNQIIPIINQDSALRLQIEPSPIVSDSLSAE